MFPETKFLQCFRKQSGNLVSGNYQKASFEKFPESIWINVLPTKSFSGNVSGTTVLNFFSEQRVFHEIFPETKFLQCFRKLSGKLVSGNYQKASFENFPESIWNESFTNKEFLRKFFR